MGYIYGSNIYLAVALPGRQEMPLYSENWYLPMKPLEITGFFLDFKSMDSSRIPMYVLDSTGRILFLNARMRELFGFSREEYMGQMIAMLGSDPATAARKITEGLENSGGNWQGEVVARAKDGRDFQCLITATRFIDKKGSHSLTMGQVRDLTRERKIEEDLSQLTARLSSLVHLSTRIAYIEDPNKLAENALEAVSELLNAAMGIIFLVNPVTGDLISYTSYGIPEEDIPHLDQAAFRSIIAAEVVKTGKTAYVPDMAADDRIIIRTSQTQSLAVVPLASQDRVIGAMGLASTAPYKFNKDNITFMETVGSLVGVYMENARLIDELDRRNRILLERNRDLEELLSIISHDLRSPLATIGGYASLLAKRGAETPLEDRTDYANIIIRKTNETSKRFDDLLKFFRVTLSENHDELEVVNVLEVIESCVRDSIPDDEREKVTVKVPDQVPYLVGKRSHLEHIFTNLISNSYKYVEPDKDPIIEVSYAPVAGEKGTVHQFTVSDNGMGIEEGYHKNLTRPFFRGPGSKDVEGAGMGLSVVDRIVRKNLGSLSFESSEGKGMSVTFTLPWQASKVSERSV